MADGGYSEDSMEYPRVTHKRYPQFEVGDMVASDFNTNRYGTKCCVLSILASAPVKTQSGWFVKVRYRDGAVLELDSGWLKPLTNEDSK